MLAKPKNAPLANRGRAVIRLHRPSTSSAWEKQQHRIIRETEQFLDYHLAHPEESVRIPAVKVGQATFQPWMTDWFWGKVLEL